MKNLIIVRGAGDLASGVIQKIWRSGFNILVLETENPSFIRKTVSYGSAMFRESCTFNLEDATSRYLGSLDSVKKENSIKYLEECHVLLKKIDETISKDEIPIIADSNLEILNVIKESNNKLFVVDGIIDAIIAKKNLGMTKDLAPITIGLGPGFIAGEDVDIVIETMRGHNLGRLIFKGSAQPNTGVPGMVGGESKLRVIYSPCDGNVEIIKDIGSIVKKDEIIGKVGEENIIATIDGLVRGAIRNGYCAHKGMKIGDIDPRIEEYENAYTISDKARALGGAALESILYLNKIKNRK